MNERLRLAAIVLVLLGACVLPGCKDDDDGDSAPTCDDLQREASGCQTTDQATKDQFAKVGEICKAQARFTAECRKCLSGHICGVTEQCDPQCGK